MHELHAQPGALVVALDKASTDACVPPLEGAAAENDVSRDKLRWFAVRLCASDHALFTAGESLDLGSLRRDHWQLPENCKNLLRVGLGSS